MAQSEADAVIFLPDWPQPSAGAPLPQIKADDAALAVRYLTDDGQAAVLHFPTCVYFSFGLPNDEALAGHPLAGRGLKHYAAHEVLNSSLVNFLEKRNRVHPRHDRQWFLDGKRHFVITFHDSTLECVVIDKGRAGPKVTLSPA